VQSVVLLPSIGTAVSALSIVVVLETTRLDSKRWRSAQPYGSFPTFCTTVEDDAEDYNTNGYLTCKSPIAFLLNLPPRPSTEHQSHASSTRQTTDFLTPFSDSTELATWCVLPHIDAWQLAGEVQEGKSKFEAPCPTTDSPPPIRERIKRPVPTPRDENCLNHTEYAKPAGSQSFATAVGRASPLFLVTS